MKLSWPKTLVDICQWAGTITGVVGAGMIASNIGVVGWGYILFAISAVCYMYFSWQLKYFPLFAMNAVFMAINLWGIWRWLIQPLILE